MYYVSIEIMKISNLHFLANRIVLVLWLPTMYIHIYNRR